MPTKGDKKESVPERDDFPKEEKSPIDSTGDLADNHGVGDAVLDQLKSLQRHAQGVVASGTMLLALLRRASRKGHPGETPPARDSRSPDDNQSDGTQ